MLHNDAQFITLQHQLTPLEATIIQSLRRKDLRGATRNNCNCNATKMPQGETSSTNGIEASSMVAALTSTNCSSGPIMNIPNTMSICSTTNGSPRAYCSPLSSPSQRPDAPLTSNSTSCTQLLVGHRDVLLGRGSKIYMHPGNMKFRHLVAQRQQLYQYVPKFEKISVAQNVVVKIQEEAWLFLLITQWKAQWRVVRISASVIAKGHRKGIAVGKDALRKSSPCTITWNQRVNKMSFFAGVKKL